MDSWDLSCGEMLNLKNYRTDARATEKVNGGETLVADQSDLDPSPSYRLKRKGTVMIVYNLRGKKLFVGSDSRLNIHVIDKIYRIFYENGYTGGLRLLVEHTAEKIIACEGFLIGLAGDFDLAHEKCTELKGRWTEGHDSLVEELEKHRYPKKHNNDTDFVLVTPHIDHGNSFRISYVTDGGARPMEGDLLGFGSGWAVAEKFFKEEMVKRRPETDSDMINLIKDTVYHVEELESTVGGTVVVAVSEVADGEGEKLSTNFFKFPCLKIIWPITIRDDGVHLQKDYLLPTAMQVWDNQDINSIMEPAGESQLVGGIGEVKLRIYSNATDFSFYQTSEYLHTQDFEAYELVLGYDQDLEEFTLSKDGSIQEFRGSINGKEGLFWDNEKEVFVIC